VGLETRIETFYALIPSPHEQIVEMVAPRSYRASLDEPTISASVDTQTGHTWTSENRP
jgi:hypothetical protein